MLEANVLVQICCSSVGGLLVNRRAHLVLVIASRFSVVVQTRGEVEQSYLLFCEKCEAGGSLKKSMSTIFSQEINSTVRIYGEKT
jgi:hypothetical protein